MSDDLINVSTGNIIKPSENVTKYLSNTIKADKAKCGIPMTE